ncbi:MAG: hypothetical protein IJ776_01035 [Paludibacteraceae bacterium]|nr:hypothetical protein [Paludibacteraceae bacterium]
MALYSGNNIIRGNRQQPSGRFVEIQGEQYYEICNYDSMQPFFISLASDTDLWMYLASTGGLTAGRQSPEKALFPYYTDDKITEQYEQTGPKTIFRVNNQTDESAVWLWEPFSEHQAGVYEIERSIAKSVVGNKIIFSELNRTLGLRFSYMWAPAGRFGWVRRATLDNVGNQCLDVEFLDGLQNVLPAGVERKTQNEFSTLVDGYKKTELAGNMVLFRMEAILVDRAEPSESLRCNTVCCVGLTGAEYMVSSRQLDAFRKGMAVYQEEEAKGVRGAIFVHSMFTLPTQVSKTWYFVADTGKDAVQVRELIKFSEQENAAETIEKAIADSTETLKRIVGQNDGIQHTGDEHNDARHFANTLFNTMRGGYYLDNYNIDGASFRCHILTFNRGVYKRHGTFLCSLPETINRSRLEQLVGKENDPQLTRLLMEYLPITFGRRHGDPSRPWNLFNIRVQDDNGRPIVSYQGNWRDIFQNWEALSVSYPGYVNGIIAKFLNATTADGYNPYKVTSEGIDWEVIEPENPWSNIGYWGDHQIIYLLKLLELSWQHDPESLCEMLNQKLFAFANVPYRFKSYNEIVADPKNTIRFDDELHKRVNALIPDYGQDARLVLDKQNEVFLTTMADKLLITLLAKLSNFVPEAGIWMNTLRPEWNDANNALVGYGASMVTLCYMRRYVAFLQKLITGDVQIGKETAELLSAICRAITCYGSQSAPATTPSDTSAAIRRQFIDSVGMAGEHYREKAYQGLSGTMVVMSRNDIQDFLHAALQIIDDSIRKNRREDGLYHAYNLTKFTEGDVQITRLYKMLEGQVAVLSSGLLTAEEAADLLDAMRQSDLYREDQRSYMLYPDRRRKSFLELNNLPEEAKDLPVVKKLLAIQGQNIIIEDRDGGLHFNAGFRNASFLEKALSTFNFQLSTVETASLCDLYESIFNHHAFTGRSGTFYKYEGLGCIYWHMVSKLLLAVGENIMSCRSPEALPRLKKHYQAIREGIGSHKQPQEYGSFPFDPYSHTPGMAGVQQPGMTGQVKEDILNRFFELGVSVENGQISFCPQLLTEADFKDGELRFTYCNTMVVYENNDEKGMIVETQDGKIRSQYTVMDRQMSEHVFARDGYVRRITVRL